jgi:HB1, ASXL, restriction endonuclease HTH domain
LLVQHSESNHAPAETLSKLSWIEGFVSDLLDPAGRERRAKAVRGLRRERNVGPSRGLTTVAKPAYRRGWVLAAVTEVLEAAGEPMRTRMIHAAVEELVGEPVSWSSVKNCLASDVGGKSPRFERVGRGRYRLASDGRV